MTAIIEPMIEGAWRRSVQSKTLAAMRDGLLPKLISGQIRVKAAEQLAEGVL